MKTITWFLLVLFVQFCLGSHFRGGYFLWKPTENPDEIDITWRVSWRRTYDAYLFCNDSDITNKTLKNGQGSLVCFGGCRIINSVITPLSFYCTDYRATEDWSTGIRSLRYNSSSANSALVFGFTGGDWIGLLQGGGSWSMIAWTNLTVHEVTRRIKHSPATSVSPIILVVQRCRVTINMLALLRKYE